MVEDSITLHYLNTVLDNLGSITIDQEFIDYRNTHVDKFNDYGRTQDEKVRNSDGLLFEYLLLKNRLVEKPKNIKHDFIISEKKIDNKMINEDANTVTIPNRKEEWMKNAVMDKELTHFSITQWTSRPEECKGDKGRALTVGDVVKFKVLAIIPARQALKDLRSSKYYVDSKYFWVK